MNQASITMKIEFAYTHWACFDCRKGFAKEPLSEGARKYPECAKLMTDMGAYFEPPRKLNKKRWAMMKILADYDDKFQSEGSKFYIQWRILQTKNPCPADVIERIKLEKKKSKSK